MRHWLALLVLLTKSVIVNLQHTPTIMTENGFVSGETDSSFSGRTFFSYLGIPFALPPVGNRRFQDPQRLTSCWANEKGKRYAPPCIAFSRKNFNQTSLVNRTYNVTGSEDCLYLNVFTNQENLKKGSQDVIVFIYGGAFQFGSSDSYQPHAMMDRHGIVFVTIAFRGGIMGFISTGDRVVPGNMGLKDQVAALEWVQRNIRYFGGDPKKVTIAGTSAGAMSVHLMYLSPLTDALFSKGISHSGTALCPRAVQNDMAERTKRLAAYFNCPIANSAAMIKCLRDIDANELVAAIQQFLVFFYNPVTVFGPTVDTASERPFLPGVPIDLLKEGKFKKLPWMNCVTSGDGLSTAAEYLSRSKPAVLTYINSNWDTLMPVILVYKTRVPSRLLNEVSEKLKHAYFGDKAVSTSTISNYVQLLTDVEFADPAVQSAALMTMHGSAVYLRQFRYRGAETSSQMSNAMPGQFGVGHADDVYYTYDSPSVSMRTTAEDRAMGQQLLDIEEAFVKTGAPPEDLGWLPFRNDSGSFRYLEINGPRQIKMVQDSKIGNTQQLSKIFNSASFYHQNDRC